MQENVWDQPVCLVNVCVYLHTGLIAMTCTFEATQCLTSELSLDQHAGGLESYMSPFPLSISLPNSTEGEIPNVIFLKLSDRWILWTRNSVTALLPVTKTQVSPLLLLPDIIVWRGIVSAARNSRLGQTALLPLKEQRMYVTPSERMVYWHWVTIHFH